MSCGFVYILRSDKNGRFYVGVSRNPLKRLNSYHNLGKVKATKNLTPWNIVFQQKYENMTMARKVEHRLKSLKSRLIIERIILEGICKIKVG